MAANETTVAGVPKWVDTGSRNLWNAAWNYAQNDPYANASRRYAPFTADQRRGMQMYRQNANIWRPYANTAAAWTRQGNTAIGDADITRLMSPYLKNVAADTTTAINRQFDTQQAQNQDAAIGARAFGGDRMAIQQAETDRNRGAEVGRAYNQLLSQGYDRAMDAATAERARNLAAAEQYARLGAAAQTQALAGAQSLMGIGSLQQQRQQQMRDYAAQSPYERMNFLRGILSGTPYSKTTKTQSSADPWALGLGTGTAVLGALGEGEVLDDVANWIF